MPGGARPGAGRKPFKATSVQRMDVQSMRAEGMSTERIAAAMNIPLRTLQRHFAREIELGADRERIRLLRQLRRAANKGSVPAIRELLRRNDMGAGSAERFAQEGKPVERPLRALPKGKKEIAREEALSAHVGTEWDEDLAPIPGTRH